MSKTTKLLILGLLSLALRAPTAVAEESTAANKDSFRAAFDACSEKYQRPERGVEPSDDFKACMKEAGFDGPPERGHHGGRGHGPRPEGPPPESGEQPSENSGGAQ